MRALRRLASPAPNLAQKYLCVFDIVRARRRERNREQGAAASESDRTFFGAAIISLRQYGLELLMIAGARAAHPDPPAPPRTGRHKQVDGGRSAAEARRN